MSSDDALDVVFKALGDARRRQMLDLLRDRARTTGELCDSFKSLDRCSVMQHLSVLEKAGLVVIRREGRVRWNYFNPLPIKELHDRWIRPRVSTAVEVLSRLKTELEGRPDMGLEATARTGARARR